MTKPCADHSPDAGNKVLTHAVMERVGRYMGVIGLKAYDDATCGYTRGKVRVVQPLRHFAADVLDKMVAEGVGSGMFFHHRYTSIYPLWPSAKNKVQAPTWPEAVLLAAAAIQEARE